MSNLILDNYISQVKNCNGYTYLKSLLHDSFSDEELDNLLYVSCYYLDIESYVFLLSLGANPYNITSQFFEPTFLLFKVKERKHFFELSIDGFTSNDFLRFDQKDDFNALLLAGFVGYNDIFFKLCELTNKFDICNKQGITPFYDACKTGNLEIIKYLLQKCDEKVIYQESIFGTSPLSVAIVKKKFDVALFLLDNAYDICKISDLYTFFINVICSENVELVEKVALFGIDLKTIYIDTIPEELISRLKKAGIRLEERLYDLLKSFNEELKPYIEILLNGYVNKHIPIKEQPQIEEQPTSELEHIEESQPSEEVAPEQEPVIEQPVEEEPILAEPINEKQPVEQQDEVAEPVVENIIAEQLHYSTEEIQSAIDSSKEKTEESTILPSKGFIVIIGALHIKKDILKKLLAMNNINPSRVRYFDYYGTGFDYKKIINNENLLYVVLGPTAHKIPTIKGNSLKSDLIKDGVNFIDLISKKITKTSLQFAISSIKYHFA